VNKIMGIFHVSLSCAYLFKKVNIALTDRALQYHDK